jgi:hypothetical protein
VLELCALELLLLELILMSELMRKILKDKVFAENILSKAKEIYDKTNMLEKEMIELIDTKI